MYLLHLGLLLVLPFVMELWLEFDLRQALSSLARDWIALSPIFHLFTMQTKVRLGLGLGLGSGLGLGLGLAFFTMQTKAFNFPSG